MAVSILLGIAAGAAGVIPIVAALYLFRKSASVGIGSQLGFGMLGVAASMVVLTVLLFACSVVAHDYVLPFGLSEIVAFIVVTTAYVVKRNKAVKRRVANNDKGGPA